jgi:hypothetical protein
MTRLLAEDLVLLRAGRGGKLKIDMDLNIAIGVGLLADLVVCGSVWLPEGSEHADGPHVTLRSSPVAPDLSEVWSWLTRNRLSGHSTAVGLGIAFHDAALFRLVAKGGLRRTQPLFGGPAWRADLADTRTTLGREVDLAIGAPDAGEQAVARAALAGTVAVVGGQLAGSRSRAAAARTFGASLPSTPDRSLALARLVAVAQRIAAPPHHVNTRFGAG